MSPQTKLLFGINPAHIILVVFIAFFDVVLRGDVAFVIGGLTTSGGRILRIAVDSTVHSLVASSIWRAAILTESSTAGRGDIFNPRSRLDLHAAEEETSRMMKPDAECNCVGDESLRGEVAAAYVLGALVDVDHFLAAGSPTLRAATNLSTRRWLVFHNPLFVAASALTLHYCNVLRPRWACLWVSSALSHLLRDATRTGLLLYPLGKTAPLPYVVFVGVVVVMPRICSAALKKERRGNTSDPDSAFAQFV